ncbi:pyridoxamine 5'-phosphate oxidase [Roseivirga sp. BDSF3-8]|uniref:pyridoxamine 5'-phosphate oxidase n=1 Tax=Roseivirga sp. BDSF3-8 TaxID=3241598 RepID=UPI00353233B9
MDTSKDIASIRKEYTRQTLEIATVSNNAIEQFKKWFTQARNADVPEVNAMTLATVSEKGQPAARIVLLKDISEGGFVFYTNYNSQKGKDLTHNPKAALVFFWPELERQVRIEGTVKKVDAETSAEYFHSRPRGSQIGAWVSPQSQPIESREVLEEKNEELQGKYEGMEVPRPAHWGGYRLMPLRIEFWQGRPSRLHDRICYDWHENGWNKTRLAP